MSCEPFKTIDDPINEIAKKDKDAAEFLSTIVNVSAVWDDLCDRDVKVENKDISRAFESILIGLPTNKFYMSNISSLHPLMMVAIGNWKLATEIERQEAQEAYEYSFVIRSSYADIFMMTAWIIYGEEYAIEFASRVRAFVHDEGLGHYQKSLVIEKLRRESM